jgi:hypothetical protein
MRYLFRLLCVCALGVVPLVGCGETVRCEMDVCPCSEQGIRAATAAGGGPYTFNCDGPTIVRTGAEILLRNDVILDGEGNLTIDGDNRHRVFLNSGAMVELRGLTVTGGSGGGARVVVDGVASHKTTGPWTVGGGIWNQGTLSLTNCTVSGNTTDINGGGIYNDATLTLANSTVSGNTARSGEGGGILNAGTLALINSTVSGNTAWTGGGLGGGEGVNLYSTLTLINSTVSGNTARSGEGSGILNAGTLALISSTVSGDIAFLGTLTSTSTLMDGACDEGLRGVAASNGYNVESPGSTCGFDQSTDKTGVLAPMLGPLQDNGGPTETHALLPGSVAIDHIPALDCEVDEDQRGEPRPETGGDGCDVGAFEVQSGD